MIYRIPNDDGQQNSLLSKMSAQAFINLADASGGAPQAGVVNGLNASPGAGTLEVDVESGYVVSSGISASIAASTIGLNTAHPTSDRVDLIVARKGDNPGDEFHYLVIEGTPDIEAHEPLNDNLGNVLIAAVYVEAAETVIPADHILDRRMAGYMHSRFFLGSSTPATASAEGHERFFIDRTRENIYGPSEQHVYPTEYEAHNSGMIVVEASWEYGDPLPVGSIPTTRILRKLA